MLKKTPYLKTRNPKRRREYFCKLNRDIRETEERKKRAEAEKKKTGH